MRDCVCVCLIIMGRLGNPYKYGTLRYGLLPNKYNDVQWPTPVTGVGIAQRRYAKRETGK